MNINDIYINDDIYQEKILEIKTVLSTYYPDFIEEGPYEDLYVKPLALLLAYTQQNFYTLLYSYNLQELLNNIDLFRDEDIDKILSFYGFVRQYISTDILNVLIYFERNDTTIIPSNMVATYNDFQFGLTRDYIFTEYPTETEFKIYEAQNNYYGYITLKYLGTDEVFIPRNSELTLLDKIPNIKKLVTISDFHFTNEKETNQQFVSRAVESFVPVGSCSKAGLLAYLQKYNLTKTTIINCGDTEMLRDADNIFQLSTGGKVDIYIQSTILPEITILAKDAELVDTENHLWKVYITPEDLTGIYYIQKILSDPTHDGSLEIVDYVLSGEGAHYLTKDDIYLTSYANIEITFRYDNIGNNTQKFYIYCYHDPMVKTIQDDIDDNFVPLGLDVLVKTYYPIFLSINCKLASIDIDTDEFKQYLVSNINKFSYGDITLSNIIELIHDYRDDIKVHMPLDVKYNIVDNFKDNYYTLQDTIAFALNNDRISPYTSRPVLLFENISVEWV